MILLFFLVQGPEPSALAVVPIDNTTAVIVIANGNVGGMYWYTVTFNEQAQDEQSKLQVQREGFKRRGTAGETWTVAFNQPDGNTYDYVSDPGIKDMM